MPELAEGARLEIVCTPKRCTEGSNPSLSAISIFDFGFLKKYFHRRAAKDAKGEKFFLSVERTERKSFRPAFGGIQSRLSRD